MRILGINISHDASSCLYEDGEIKYYIEDERLAEIKHYEYVIPDHLKFYGLEKLLERKINHLDYVIFSSYRRLDTIDSVIISTILDQIKSCKITIGKVHFLKEEHHMYHAYNAHYNSKFSHSVAVVADGGGAYEGEDAEALANIPDTNYINREVESIYYFGDNVNDRRKVYKHYSNIYMPDGIRKITPYHMKSNALLRIDSNSLSAGKIFASACSKVGLSQGNDAGKLMGMSAYGKIVDHDDWIDPGVNTMITAEAQKKLDDNIKINMFEDKANFAKKIQEVTKQMTINLIQQAIDMTKSENVVLSGGYFLNAVNNYEYIKAFPNTRFYIDPMAYDAGTAMGAVYFLCEALGQPIKPIDNLYLGG
jgi:predicted NodU family carbamoyl transferase